MDIGQLVLGKIEAQNAADASAMTAAAVKASMHNTRSMAYRAASGQLDLARLQMVRATGIALQEIADPGKNSKDFDDAMKLAELHRTKLTLLRQGLETFNTFATGAKAGPAAVQEAAEAVYRANLGMLAVSNPANRGLLDRSAMAEISGGAANGVVFRSEGMDKGGHAGKSAVTVNPRAGSFGGGMLGYASSAMLSATAVAGPVEAHKQLGKNLRGVDRYGIDWYTVRLLPVGKGSLGK
ncbi:MAG: hypothetical protein JWM80_411, partial [Cyanobacteria bacterium RYN_339]|nr:hypothetical protein [Cyanobacteria bacterium RYN_339]